MTGWLKGSVLLLAALAILATGFVAQGTAQARNGPKLILQITVDQLRGDLLARYYDRLGVLPNYVANLSSRKIVRH